MNSIWPKWIRLCPVNRDGSKRPKRGTSYSVGRKWHMTRVELLSIYLSKNQTIIPNSEAFDVEIDENIELSTRDLEASVSVPNKVNPDFNNLFFFSIRLENKLLINVCRVNSDKFDQRKKKRRTYIILHRGYIIQLTLHWKVDWYPSMTELRVILVWDMVTCFFDVRSGRMRRYFHTVVSMRL